MTDKAPSMPVAGPVPQSTLTKVEKGLLWFSSIATAAIVAFLFSLHGDVGRLDGQYGSVEKVLTSTESRIGEFGDRLSDFNRRFDDIDKGIAHVREELGSATAMIRGVMSRQYMVEADPEGLAEQMGYQLGSSYKARFVDSKLYLFPQTDEAESDLRSDARFQKTKLSPVLFGWEIRRVAGAASTPSTPPN